MILWREVIDGTLPSVTWASITEMGGICPASKGTVPSNSKIL